MGLVETVETYAREYAPLAKALDRVADLTKDGSSEAFWKLLPSNQPFKKQSFERNISNAYDSIRDRRILGGGAIFWYEYASDGEYKGIAKSRRLNTLAAAIDQGVSDGITSLLSGGETSKAEYNFFQTQEKAGEAGIKTEKLQARAIDIVRTYMESSIEKLKRDDITATMDYDRGIEFAEKSGVPLIEIQPMKRNALRNLTEMGLGQIESEDYFSASMTFEDALKIAQSFGVDSREVGDLSRSFVDAYVAKGESQGLKLAGPIMSIIGIQNIVDSGSSEGQEALDRLNRITYATVREVAIEAANEDSGRDSRLIN